MKHNYLCFILLYCIKKFRGERSLSAIYHLLKGKKSSQTIQDGKLFNLSYMFSLFPKLTRQQLNQVWEEAIKEELIEKVSDQKYILTKKGTNIIDEIQGMKPIPSNLNGWEFGDVGRFLWRRLSLLVQVLSNLAYENKHYLPLTKNQEDLQWVKNFLKRAPITKQKLIDQLYAELKQILSFQNNKDALLFVQRLSSNKKIGKTIDQIAIECNEDRYYIYLCFWNVIHSMVQLHHSNELTTIILSELIKDKLEQNALTSSTATTRSYLLRGNNINQIATARRLKESTIEDHIVEITLHDHTYIPEDFLSPKEYEEINRIINMLDTHQLKIVKEHLNHRYSYFQIRLAYALNGRNR